MSLMSIRVRLHKISITVVLIKENKLKQVHIPVRKSIHGELVPAKLPEMNCGGVPLFDSESGCAYRCDKCFAIIGSIGQSQLCKELNGDV